VPLERRDSLSSLDVEHENALVIADSQQRTIGRKVTSVRLCLTQAMVDSQLQLIGLHVRLANATFKVAEIHYKTALRTRPTLGIHSARHPAMKTRPGPVARAFDVPVHHSTTNRGENRPLAEPGQCALADPAVPVKARRR
jgi:hypothetical protein